MMPKEIQLMFIVILLVSAEVIMCKIFLKLIEEFERKNRQ